jgi:triosephosphate isomerase
MRKKLICGNWKMYKNAVETAAFFRSFLPLVRDFSSVDIGIAPTYTSLAAAAEALAGSSVLLGAQNVHWADEGAYTGEISAGMLREIGCAFAIVGHSERRQFFGETDEGVSKRTGKAIEKGLLPVVCVGETLAERDGGHAFSVVERQVKGAFAPLAPEAVERSVIAYEPVWAIGTGRTATAAQAQEMHAHVRSVVAQVAGAPRAAKIRILYGGSVKPANAAEIMNSPDVDGALVGGASLDAETFASIVRFQV